MFEWDEAKEITDIAKHGISFAQASRIFAGRVWTFIDTRTDYGEVREISIGVADAVAFLTVVHTDWSGVTRIISARPASQRERKRYDEALRASDDTR